MTRSVPAQRIIKHDMNCNSNEREKLQRRGVTACLLDFISEFS